MALNVETGSGSASAESYASVVDADTRLANLGLTNWAPLLTAEKEQALRRATAYMEQSYRTRWQGNRMTAGQALSWPRYDVCIEGFTVSTSSVPAEVRNACIDLAFKAAAGDLNADLTRGVLREKVGPLETEYDPHSPISTRYPSIDQQLIPYLRGSSACVGLVRS